MGKTKKSFWVQLLYSITLLATAGETDTQKFSAQKEFIVAIDDDYAPFTFKNTEGEASGIFVDLWREWARVNHYRVSFRFYTWNGALEATKKGEVDFHSGTSDDYEWMVPSNKIYEVSASFYLPQEIRLEKIEDLKDKRVGAIDKYYAKMVKGLCGKRCDVVIYDIYDALTDALVNGKIDMAIDDEVAYDYHLMRRHLYGKFNKSHVGLEEEMDSSVYAIVNEKNKNLLLAINQGLKHLDISTLLEIEKRWLANPKAGYWHKEELLQEQKKNERFWQTIIVVLTLLLAGVLVLYYKRTHYYKSVAMVDPLTGLFNKRAFETFVINDAKSIAIILVDVDYFKEYNDTYGHQAGDELLEQIGMLLKDAIESHAHAVAYRVGGDEFTLRLFDKNEEEVKRISQEILEKMHALQIEHEKSPYGIATLSLGAGVVEGLSCELDQVYNCADDALYRAKKEGRNKAVVKRCDAS